MFILTSCGNSNLCVTQNLDPNSPVALTAYSLNGSDATIIGHNVAVKLPYGTNLNEPLIATYTTSTVAVVKVGSVIQISGKTANTFTNQVIYTLIGLDKTTVNYTVTVTVATNSENAITEYSLDGVAAQITGNKINVLLPYGTSTNELVAKFTTTGQTVTVNNVPQISAQTENNFTIPVTYIVTAVDGSIQNYLVTVVVPPTYFLAYYPPGCTPNQSTTISAPEAYDCIQNPVTKDIYYADGSQSGKWPAWKYTNSGTLGQFNETSHCGLTNGSWELLSAPNPTVYN